MGGTSDDELGSDPTKIVDAVAEAKSVDKFFVFADLGSAVLSAELAFDMLEEDQQAKYILVDAPLVEGAFAAGITASVSDDFEHILAEAKMLLRRGGNRMKKIINEPQDIIEEMVTGIVKSYPDLVHRIADSRVIAKNSGAKQVGLISGGGSGHEPAHAGFVGNGMLSAAVLGDVFTSPTPDQIEIAINHANQGQGVLLIVKNYTGDILNFEMAKDLADMNDIPVEIVVVDDDIAVEDSTYTAGKRGVAGTVLVHKILGDAARNGSSLSELKELGDRIVAATKTIGVALKAATVPEVGKPGFSLAEDEIEFGVGIHGEPGYRREKLQPSKELAKEMVSKLTAAYDQKPKEIGVLVNGMGGTPLMEQFVFINDVLNLLLEENIHVSFHKVGNYMTSIDMQGLSLTFIDLTDSAWQKALSAEVSTISW